MSDRDRTCTGAAGHWPTLDGLRGVAVAAVVAYHVGWVSGGFLGVDLFFTLSGFLITTVLIREWRSTGRIDLGEFWARRCRRLLPAVTLMIAAVLAIVAVWGTAAEQAGARSDARWALPYLANWHLVADARDYWAGATTLSVFNHLWSLAIEEQFYVVWPLIAWWALRRRGERGLAVVALLGATASLVAMVVLARHAPASRVYFGTDTRVASVLLGAAAATAPCRDRFERWRHRRPRRIEVAAAVIGVLLLGSWIAGGQMIGALVGGGMAVHGLLAAVLVLALSAETSVAGRPAPASRASDVVAHPALVWLGRRSYGIYLWHWPVIQLLEPRWTTVPAGVRDAVEIGLTLVIAEGSYRLLEHPVRRRIGWAWGRRSAAATLATVSCAALVAVIAPSGRGDVAAFELTAVSIATAPRPVVDDPPDPAVTVDRTVAPSLPGTTTATPRVSPITTESAGTPDALAAPAPPRTLDRMLWVGDSVAADLEPALTAAFGAAGVEVLRGAFDGAHLVPGAGGGDGDDPRGFYGPMIPSVSADAVVVQLSTWDAPAPIDDIRTHIGWFHDTVRRSGADLVLVSPPPMRSDLVDPGLANLVRVAGELVASDPDHVVYLDAAVVWGTEMLRDLDGDGAPDRKPDGVHVCPQGAARFAAWLVDAIDAEFAGLSPVFPAAWVSGSWQDSERYDTPVGACAAVEPGGDALGGDSLGADALGAAGV